MVFPSIIPGCLASSYFQGFASSCQLCLQCETLPALYEFLSSSEVLPSSLEKLEQWEEKIIYSNFVTFCLCAMTISRVAFVINRYTLTCSESCIMYGVFALASSLLSYARPVKDESSNLTHMRHNFSRGLFYSIFLLKTATILTSIALLIFYRDYCYIAGMLSFVFLNWALESDRLIKEETSRNELLFCVHALAHSASVIHQMVFCRILSVWFFASLVICGFFPELDKYVSATIE